MDGTCMYKMPETSQLCGSPATKKTAVNEDPWGAGEWCEAHAPATAVSTVPADPNKDPRAAAEE